MNFLDKIVLMEIVGGLFIVGGAGIIFYFVPFYWNIFLFGAYFVLVNELITNGKLEVISNELMELTKKEEQYEREDSDRNGNGIP